MYHWLDTYTRVQLLSTCKHLRVIAEITRPFAEGGDLESDECTLRITDTKLKRGGVLEEENDVTSEYGFGNVIIGCGIRQKTSRSYIIHMPCHLTFNTNREPVQSIGKKNEIRVSSHSYLGNITIIGSNNVVIVNDFVVCKGITIIGNNCKIVFNGFVRRYENIEIIKLAKL